MNEEKLVELAEWLDDTVAHIVTQPDDVKVEVRRRHDGFYQMVIYVAPVDRGLIIGSQGTTIEALRLLARKQAYRFDASIYVDLSRPGRDEKAS